MVDRDVAAEVRQAFLQDADTACAQRLRVVIGDHGAIQVPRGAEGGGGTIAASHPVRRHPVYSLALRREVVDEEAETGQHAAGADDALGEQPVNVRGAEAEVPREGEPVGHADLIGIERHAQIAALDHAAHCQVDRGLRRQRLAAELLPQIGGRRDGPVVRQVHDDRVVDRGDVEGVGLTGRGGAEAGAGAHPQRERLGHSDAGGHLAVDGAAEVGEVLEAARHAERPRTLRLADLQVGVSRDVVAVPDALGQRTEAGEPVRSWREALLGQRTLGPARPVARNDLEALVPVLCPAREVDPVVDRVREVDVQVGLLLVVDAGVEVRGARLVGNVRRELLVGGAGLVRPERRVDRVVHVEVHVGLAPGRAGIPGEPIAHALEAHDRGGVQHVGAELRSEPAGEHLLEGPAVGVGQQFLPRGLVGHHAAGDGHPGATRRPVEHAVLRVQKIAHQQEGPVVVAGAKHAAAGVRVPEVEPALDLLGHVVAVAVELGLVAEDVARVRPQLELVGDLRRSPDLGRIPHAGVPLRVDEGECVVALHATVRRQRVAVLAGHVQEAGLAERKPEVAGERVHVAVAGKDPPVHPIARIAQEVAAGLELERAPGAVVLEHKVHHAGDRVGSVLGRGAVAQHLGLLQRRTGDERDVGPLRPVGKAVSVPGYHRRPVAPLPVDQHQRVVGRQAAQVGGPREGGRVRNRLDVDVERRHDVAQQVGEVGIALLHDLACRDHVDGNR